MASPWDFITTWVEHSDKYPDFLNFIVPVDGENVCTYLAGGQVRKMVTSVSGLDHLNGQLAYVVLDGGGVTAPFIETVASGTIALSVPAAVIHVGLPYQGKVQFLPLGGDGQTVNETKERKVFDIVFRLFQSLGGRFGKDEDNMFPLDYSDLDTSDVLYTGDFHNIPFESSVENYWTPVFIQDEPLPFMLLAAVIRSEIFEDK